MNRLNGEELRRALNIVRNKHPGIKTPEEMAQAINEEFFTKLSADDISLITTVMHEDFERESRKIHYYHDRTIRS